MGAGARPGMRGTVLLACVAFCALGQKVRLGSRGWCAERCDVLGAAVLVLVLALALALALTVLAAHLRAWWGVPCWRSPVSQVQVQMWSWGRFCAMSDAAPWSALE